MLFSVPIQVLRVFGELLGDLQASYGISVNFCSNKTTSRQPLDAATLLPASMLFVAKVQIKPINLSSIPATPPGVTYKMRSDCICNFFGYEPCSKEVEE